MKERRRREGGGSPRVGFRRWPSAVAVLVIGALYAVISNDLTLGPRAFLLGLVAVLLVPLMTAHLRGNHHLARGFGFGVVGLATVAVTVSAFFLVSSALGRGTFAPALLRDATLLWIINVVNFAVWYWEVDGGGPARRRPGEYRSDDLLFPQMNLTTEASRTWHPGFSDYLFLAFNTSTAFSPTDTAFLSRRVKALMMGQAMLSLVILVVLVGRAINALAA